MEPLRFNVFGRIVLVQREAGLWQAYALGADGKRSPAGFVIPTSSAMTSWSSISSTCSTKAQSRATATCGGSDEAGQSAMDILQALLAQPLSFAGRGLNHEGEAFDGAEISISPVHL